MEEFSITQPFGFMRIVFQIGGIWSERMPWPFSYVAYSVVVQTIFIFAYGVSMCVNLASIENIEDITESLYMTLTIVSFIVKVLNLLVKHRSVSGCLERVKTPLMRLETENELEWFREAYNSFNRQRNFLLFITWSCLLSALYASAIGEVERLPFPGWYPIDWKQNRKYFWIVYGYQVLAMGLSCTMNVASDLTSGYLFFQISIFFRLISKRLAVIGHASCDGGSYEDEKAIRELIRCIKMHQFVARMAKDAEDILTVPTFIQFNVSGIVLCFTAYQMTLLSPLTDTGTFFQYFLFMICMLIQNSLPCYYGNEVIIESNLVSTALYSSNWTELPLQYKKLAYHFMERLKKPTILKAGGYFIIGLNALTSIIQSSYSFFALIVNLDK